MTGILVPMPEEIELIMSQMAVTEIIEAGMRKFYKGTLYEKPVVVALSRIGKVASAVTAAVMIHQFNVDRIIVTGVAGGVRDKVKIGDICIATDCVQHDMDARGLFPRFEIPLLGIIKFEADKMLTLLAQNAASQFLKNDFDAFIDMELKENFDLYNARVHAGLLGSGDQFIGSKSKVLDLRLHFPDMIFVEMEGAAVGQVCYEYQVPLINIRTISDQANDEAHIDFQSFIDKVAKYYTLGVVKNLLQML